MQISEDILNNSNRVRTVTVLAWQYSTEFTVIPAVNIRLIKYHDNMIPLS
jgi:hypothetical protein